jgi:hypothetical protein
MSNIHSELEDQYCCIAVERVSAENQPYLETSLPMHIDAGQGVFCLAPDATLPRPDTTKEWRRRLVIGHLRLILASF